MKLHAYRNFGGRVRLVTADNGLTKLHTITVLENDRGILFDVLVVRVDIGSVEGPGVGDRDNLAHSCQHQDNRPHHHVAKNPYLFIHVGRELGMKPGHDGGVKPPVRGAGDVALRLDLGRATNLDGWRGSGQSDLSLREREIKPSSLESGQGYLYCSEKLALLKVSMAAGLP